MPARGTGWPYFIRPGRFHQLDVSTYILRQSFGGRSNAQFYERPFCVEASKNLQSAKRHFTRHSVSLVNKEHNVDTNSLRNTLEAHRDANRASLIVKIAGKGSGRQPIKLPSLSERHTLSLNPHTHGSNVKHLKSLRGLQRKRSGQLPKKQDTPIPAQRRELLLPEWVPNSALRYTQRYPWMKFVKADYEEAGIDVRSTATEQMVREIDTFYTYMRATPDEKKAADGALNDFVSTMAQAVPDAKIEVVGSRATGLDLPTSDIDLNISDNSTCSSPSSTQALLEKIATCLRETENCKRQFRSVQRRFAAKIPLVIARHAATYLEVQIQSTLDVYLSMHQTVAYVNEYPTLSKLFVLLKHALTIRGLSGGKEQGITSYPLIVMIVAALKFSEGKIHRRDSASQLLFFLDMYADIDFGSTAISLSPLEYVVKRHPHNPTVPLVGSAAPSPDRVPVHESDHHIDQQEMEARRRFATIKPGAEFLMCLQDPANLQNDLGRATYRIREVQDVFICLRQKLRSDLKRWDEGKLADRNHPLLASAVGGDYRLFEHRRKRLRESTEFST